jgi:hypothetical protein
MMLQAQQGNAGNAQGNCDDEKGHRPAQGDTETSDRYCHK